MATPSKPNKEKIILDAAISLFTYKGFHATTMDDVAKKAGISKGLSYFYYKNKEDLYLAVTRKAFDGLKEIFRDVFKIKGRTGLEMITDLTGQYLHFAQANKMYYEAIINFMGIVNLYSQEELRATIHPLILKSEHFQKLLDTHHDCGKIGAQMVSHGIKDGSIRPELQPEVTFYTIWSMLIGYEKLMGPVRLEGKEIKIHLDNWRPGFVKLMHDMLKGTIQAQRVQPVQASLF
jgi:AcrR family transcriptional regulator